MTEKVGRRSKIKSRRWEVEDVEEETLTKEERKWESIILVQEGVPQLEQQEILMKQLVVIEPAQNRICIERWYTKIQAKYLEQQG